MTQEEEIAHLRAENQALREAQSQALAQLSEVQEHLRLALLTVPTHLMGDASCKDSLR